jgi:hypothetical protein
VKADYDLRNQMAQGGVMNDETRATWKDAYKALSNAMTDALTKHTVAEQSLVEVRAQLVEDHNVRWTQLTKYNAERWGRIEQTLGELLNNRGESATQAPATAACASGALASAASPSGRRTRNKVVTLPLVVTERMGAHKVRTARKVRSYVDRERVQSDSPSDSPSMWLDGWLASWLVSWLAG